MGARVFVGSGGTVTITHRIGTADNANGLAIVSPAYEVLTTNARTGPGEWVREFPAGSEVVLRLLPNGTDQGTAWDSTGSRARELATTETFLEVSWEDRSDGDFDDAFTTIDGGFMGSTQGASIPVVAGRRYWMRFIVDDWENPWGPTSYGGHPSMLKIVEPVDWYREIPLPYNGWWPGSGLIPIGPFGADANLVLELTTGGGFTLRSDGPHADNAGSGITPAPLPYRSDPVAPGLPYIRVSWEVTAVPGHEYPGSGYDRNDCWTYLFEEIAGGWQVGQLGFGG